VSSRDGLEAALAAAWDRETLAVYADHLQAEGDPRGELIVLDLELASRSTPELVARRSSLLSAWLGPLVPSDPHVSWIGDSFRFGFVEDLVLEAPLDADRLAAILGSPLAPYLKRVTLRGDAGHIASALAGLATRQHAWLAELIVFASDGPTDRDAVAAFVAATPALSRLEVAGDNVFAELSHPALRRLSVIGATAFPPLYAGDDALAGVGALRFAICHPSLPPETEIPPFALPGLRRLDLSPNEPEAVRMGWLFDPEIEYDVEDAGGQPRVPTALDLLGTQPIRSQLTHLTLPSIRTRADLETLERLVADMPRLEEVEVARGHYLRLPPEIAGSTARFVRPTAWPWPRTDQILEGDSIHVVIPGSRSGDTVPLDDAARMMERCFEDLDPDARYAWTRFWVLIAELGALPWRSDPHATWTDERTFPAELLVTALETDIGGSGGWRELRDSLRFRRPFPPDATVTIHRVRSL